ncbi:C4-dicarboxylate ABC transporter [Streptomyces sulfonofaciens]|uniref:C4-dicarboxylate ABC transporter n=1 Tax=Streptomyces sulfonofaciens TaxID=68272 RepID=A0A919L4G1_9ACTN|nr:TDT family transporter [Streptomyces sulfonofaciens]GHH82316.1 C4-dicarboxylate ABC transporter [Streptomyces sulfonofaciens]
MNPLATTRRTARQHGRRLPGPLLRALDRPSDLFRHLGPNWYASIMGTGIVANAAATLPVHIVGLRTAGTAVWALAAVLLVGLTSAWAVHWTRYREEARAHAGHPVMAYFWGAPAMAVLTVGAGSLSLGRDWIGLRPAVAVAAALWSIGTLLGLVTCVWIPYRVMTGHEVAADAAFGGWLMPVVPPMVSAATGAALLPHLAPGQGRLSLLLGCYAMLGISLFAALVTITQIWARLVHHKLGPAALVPTLWIVLGPLGQSVTAANLLGGVARLALPRPYSSAAEAFGFLYGIPAWGFAMMWLALAAAMTLRTARGHLPFSLAWWSFTFPVGTCVTGTSALAARLGSVPLAGAAVGLYAVLVGAWAAVAVRTLLGSARGELFLPASRALPPPAA